MHTVENRGMLPFSKMVITCCIGFYFCFSKKKFLKNILQINYQQVTVFLPTNNAWNSLSNNDYHFWINRDHLPYLFKHHVVKGLKSAGRLQLNSRLQSLLPSAPILVTNVTDDITITDVETNVTIQNQIPTLGKNFAKILFPDLQTFGGLLHVIDSILIPPRDVVEDYTNLTDLVKNTSNPSFNDLSKFFSYLNQTGVADRINSMQETYTIFALTDALLDEQQTVGYDNLTRLFSYHVIMGKIIRLEDVESGEHEETLAGPGYQVTLIKKHSTALVNGQLLEGNGMRTKHGIIHKLSSSLLRPRKSRCDQTKSRLSRRECQPCTPGLACPFGSTFIGKLPCRGRRVSGLYPIFNGVSFHCTLLCLVRERQPACCPNFYGNECEPCPGGIDNTCFKHGSCNDGIKGNGMCTCNRGQFSGPACDDCMSKYYGQDCDLKCKCVNGSCRDGKLGDGSCACSKGYTGSLCNITKPHDDECGGACATAATCQLKGRCICDLGYSGNGTTCTPINPCKDGSQIDCHAFARCKYTYPGQYQCLCKDGYSGDGVYCSEINPCLNESASMCDSNAQCHHTGPNQHNCICNQHFTGDGKSCQRINICEGGEAKCHKFAICKDTEPGKYECRCLSHYIGDGVNNCTGDIYIEAVKRRLIIWMSTGVVDVISSPGQITVFFPQVDLSTNPVQTHDSIDLGNIVACSALNKTRLTELGVVYTLDGRAITVSSQNGSILLNDQASLADDGLQLSNGFVYTITGSLYPNDTTSIIPNTNNVTVELRHAFMHFNATKFYELLSFANIIDEMTSSHSLSWTLLVPTDKTFSEYPYRYRQMMTDSNVAQEYLRYHMMSSSASSIADLIVRAELQTNQGSSVYVSCSPLRNGKLVLNQGAASIIKVSYFTNFPKQPTFSANVILIDSILVPPSIGGRCDLKQEYEALGDCTSCWGMRCPAGTSMIGRNRTVCWRTSRNANMYYFSKFLQCSPICRGYNVTLKCCDGYYGKDCHQCPVFGSPRRTCNGKGKCDDGINGSGVCRCQEGYSGVACELCSPGRFGGSCDLCQCSHHGKCEEGIYGSGFCHCDQSWTGPLCKQRVARNATCNNTCPENAICGEDGQCMCKYGYTGNGEYLCEPIDFCAFGPCSKHATCVSSQFRVSCACKHPYVGDGYVCTGYDPCTNASTAPSCHPMADCVLVGPNVTRCQCRVGYVGDGVTSCTVDSEISRPPSTCAINNGGCAREAICKESHPPGVDPIEKRSSFVPEISCACKGGFAGDGFICNGNIFQVLSQGLFHTGRFYQKVVRKNFLYLIKFRQSANLTLFVPSDRSMKSKRPSRKVMSRHVVSGSVYTEEHLRSSSVVLVDSRNALPVQKSPDGSLYINGIKIVSTDIPATNGIIHVLDGIIPQKTNPLTTPSSAPSSSRSTTSQQILSTTSKALNTKASSPGKRTRNMTIATAGTKPAKTKANQKLPEIKHDSSLISVKVGVSVSVVVLILIVLGLLYWRKRNGMFVFRPLAERFSGSRLEIPIGGDLDNPVYDSTAFSDPLINE